jgi:hypothetical protein
MRLTTGVRDPLAFRHHHSKRSPVEPEVHKPDRNLLYQASRLHGFTEAGIDAFVEFTENGPQVFMLGEHGATRLYPNDFYADLFVPLPKHLAILYFDDPVLSDRICSMLVATSQSHPASFLRTAVGFYEDHLEFFIALSDLAQFNPLTRLSIAPVSFTLIQDRGEAFGHHWHGQPIFSSQRPFVVGAEQHLSRGFDHSAASYYLGAGDDVHACSYVSFRVSGSGMLYVG